MNNLPPNWSWVKLSDIGEIVAGGTPSTKIPEYFDGEIAWITPADLTGYKNKYISRGRRNISEEGLKDSSARLIPKGSILFSSRAPIGYVAIASNDVSTNQGFKNLVVTNEVNSEFVYYYLKSAKRLAIKNASGTTFKEISSTNFAKIPIPLPPLPEQKKIVEKIEELFSQLESGVASLKKVKKQLRLYRQSVLAFAFSGKLVREIGNRQKAAGKTEMLKAAEPKVDYSDQLPEGWKWVKLGEVCDKIQDGSHFSPQKSYNQKVDGRYLYITSKNIRNNYLALDNVTYVEKDFHNSIFQRCNPEFGDVLLTKDGANTGNVTINTLKEQFSLLSSVCLIKPNKEIVNSHFIKYYLQSPSGFKAVTGAMTGTAIKRIILRTIKDANIVLPPLIQQTQIVEEIEKRFSEADNLEKAIDESLEKADRLRQNILKKAFEGKLI